MPPRNRRYKPTPRPAPDPAGMTAEQRTALLLATPVAEMALSVRVVNTFEDNGIIFAADIVTQTYASLMAMKNFGEKTLGEVRAAVAALGLPVPAWEKPAAKPRPPAAKKRPPAWGGLGGLW